MTIRPAVESDVDQIRALIESIPGLWHPDWRPDVLERAIRSADGLALVWMAEDQIVGFACAHDVGLLAYLSLLAVAEGARGRGIGAALIRHIVQILQADGCGSQINTSYVERDNLTSRQSNGRLVRKTLSHSKKKEFLQRHLDRGDAVFNFVHPHRALKIELTTPAAHCRRWEQRTPAMAAGLTDHIWSLEELLSYRLPSPTG